MGTQFWEFQDSHLGVLGQNDIWVLVPWLGIEYTIRGKVVVSPKSKPWWILWIYGCSWFVRAPKCSNYALNNLLFGFCRFVWISELFINLPSLHPEAWAHPSTLEVLRARECAPFPSLFVVFTFGLVVESIKELRGALGCFLVLCCGFPLLNHKHTTSVHKN